MNTKEKLKNDILVGMRTHLDINQMSILEAVIANAVKDLEITEIVSRQQSDTIFLLYRV